MKRHVWPVFVVILLLAASVGAEETQTDTRFGLFGVSGIFPDYGYFDELEVDCGTSGFWIGLSEGYIGSNKEQLHTRKMREFVEHGITPIATIYLGEVDSDTARWAEEIVRYYSSGQGAIDVGVPVLYWELGDEQNGTWGTSCAPEEYARRVSIVAPAIRRGCPDCQIVMGGLLDGPRMSDWALDPYLRGFLAAGGAEWIDVYAFHYFGLAKPDPALPEAQLYDSAEAIVANIRAALAEVGAEGCPIWVTETATFSGGMGSIEQSENEQAADLVKRYALLGSLGVEVAQWCYVTEPQYEGTGVGFFDQCGLIYDGEGPYDRGAGVKKRAYHAYVELVRQLGDGQFVTRATQSGVTSVQFATPEGPVTVLWQDPWVRTGPVWVESEGNVIVEGICGEAMGVFAGRFRLDLGIEPVYLAGDVAAVSLAAPLLQAPGS